MKTISFTNKTQAELLFIVEPIAEEYIMHPGDDIVLSPPLYLDSREEFHIQISCDTIVVFAPEDIAIRINGEIAKPTDI